MGLVCALAMDVVFLLRFNSVKLWTHFASNTA